MNIDMLYEKMFQMKAAQPWKTLEMDQVFALETSGKICYVQMTQSDEHRALRIYQNENDLKSCIAMLEEEASTDGSIAVELAAQTLSQSTLICALTSREDLEEDEEKAVRTYAAAHGISLRGRFAWPQCLRLVYFQPPRHPGTEDEQIMAASIDAIIWLSKHMKEIGIGIRKIGSNSQWITLLRKEADGYVAGDMAMPKLPETVIPEGESLNDIYQMKTRKMKKHGTWFCQLVIPSEPRPADGVEGLHYPWELFTFDLDRKQQVAVQAVRDYVHRTNVMLDKLMEAIFREERCPKTIRVSDERTEKLLRGWCTSVGIELSMGDVPEELRNDDIAPAQDLEQDELMEDIHHLLDVMLKAPDEALLRRPKELAAETKYVKMLVLRPETPEEIRQKALKLIQRIENLLNKEQATSKKATGKRKKTPEKSLVISVSLESGCYRHIQISSKETLDSFSDAILDAFCFDNDHAHAFFMDNSVYSPWDCYYCPGIDEGYRLTTETTLEEAGAVPGKKFKYLFDFGEDWTFQCRVLKELDEKTAHPKVIRSKGDAPDQYFSWDDDDWDADEWDDDDEEDEDDDEEDET